MKGGPSSELTPVDFKNGSVIHTGSLRLNVGGKSPVSKVKVGYDGEEPTQVLWIINPLVIRLPCKVDGKTPWKTGSSHTVTIRTYAVDGTLSSDNTYTIRKGVMTDINGDGFSDMATSADVSDIAGTNRGIVYVYHGSETGIPTTPTTTLSYPGSTDGARFGSRVRMAGDVNGDGFGDLLVTTFSPEAVYVYLGTYDGITATPQVTLSYPGVDASPYYGYSLSTAGDVNGDGYDDIVVGAINSDVICADCGTAYVYLGSAAGIDSTVHRNLTYPGANGGIAAFGQASAGGGDVDGDGYADLVVTALLEDGAGTARGAAFLYRGSANGIANTVAQTIAYPESDDSPMFGWSASLTGDYNNDGLSDLLVGAYSSDVDLIAADDRGRAFIYNGKSTGLSTTVSTTLASPTLNTLGFGYAVSDAGDVNGDGFTDLAVAANQESGEGVIYLYHGATSGPSTTASSHLTYPGADSGALLGSNLTCLGDTNGDGYMDFSSGAPSSDISGTNRGHLYLFNGSATGVSTSTATGIAYPGSDDGAAFGNG